VGQHRVVPGLAFGRLEPAEDTARAAMIKLLFLAGGVSDRSQLRECMD
jgi:hypothetical protein